MAGRSSGEQTHGGQSGGEQTRGGRSVEEQATAVNALGNGQENRTPTGRDSREEEDGTGPESDKKGARYHGENKRLPGPYQSVNQAYTGKT